jgi:hypothetical protein
MRGIERHCDIGPGKIPAPGKKLEGQGKFVLMPDRRLRSTRATNIAASRAVCRAGAGFFIVRFAYAIVFCLRLIRFTILAALIANKPRPNKINVAGSGT